MQSTPPVGARGVQLAKVGVAARLADLASADEPDIDSIMPQLQGLVGALVDQLAAGQVETLYGLQTAAASVRRNSADLQAACQAPVQHLYELLEVLRSTQAGLESMATTVAARVATQIGEQVGVVVEQRLAAAEASMAAASAGLVQATADLGTGVDQSSQQLLARVTQATADLGTGVDQSSQQLLDRVTQATEQLRLASSATVEAATTTATRAAERVAVSLHEFGDGVARSTTDAVHKLARAADALVMLASEQFQDAGLVVTEAAAAQSANARELQTGLIAATTEALHQIDHAVDVLAATGTRFDEGIERTTRAAVDTFGEVIDNLVAVSTETLDGVDFAGRTLLSALAKRIDVFYKKMDEVFVVQSQRDSALGAELDGRVHKLVERSDAVVTRLSDRLRKETERLTRRDEEQEIIRAASFLEALESLLARSGGRRNLRDRVRDSLTSERLKRELLVAEEMAGESMPVTAVHLEELPDASPPVEAVARKPVPTKSVPRKAPVTRQPKASPMKSTIPRKRTPPKQEENP